MTDVLPAYRAPAARPLLELILNRLEMEGVLPGEKLVK